MIEPKSAIGFTTYGEPDQPALVLLHSLAMSQRMWTPEIISLFGADRHLITCDLPGHGESPLAESMTIEAMADRVARLLHELTVSTAAVIGMSMGGCVAQALAIRHPALVRGLGLVDTTAAYDAAEAWRERASRARTSGIESLAQFQAERWLTASYRERRPDEVARLLGIFSAMDLDSYEAACHALGAVDLRPKLSEIVAPTAVVVGADDYATPPTHAAVLRDGITNARLVVLEDTRHLSLIERPTEVHQNLAAVL